MSMSKELSAVVDTAAPLWAGEAEVMRTYFDSDRRNRESDMLWLRRQCKKEFWDLNHFMDNDQGMYLGPVEMLREAFPKLETEVDRHEVLELAEMMYEEFRHYVLFADCYDLVRGPDGPPLIARDAGESDEWPENITLGEVRKRHRDEHGELGARVCRFTEGGYCTLFREGTRLAGKGGVDDAIAKACQSVMDDEAGHMLKGILGLDEEGLGTEEWSLFAQLTSEQLQARIHMRNAQFGYPLSAERIAEIFAGNIEPHPLDLEMSEAA